MFNKGTLYSLMLAVPVIFLGSSSASFAAASRMDSSGYADSDNCVSCRSWAYVGTLSAGPLWTFANDANTLYLTPEIRNKYTVAHNPNVEGTGELFLGIQHLIEDGFNGQLGFAVAFASTKINGNIWENASSAYSDSTYKFTVNSVRYAGKGKLIVDVPYGFAGYLSGSAGVSANNATHYTATIPLLHPVATFGSNQEVTFSYTVGTGLERSFSEHWRGGVGYEFANWGKYGLSRAPWQTVNHGLGFSHLYTNELQFSITYVV